MFLLLYGPNLINGIQIQKMVMLAHLTVNPLNVQDWSVYLDRVANVKKKSMFKILIEHHTG